MARTERNYGPFDWCGPVERDGYLHSRGQGKRRRGARRQERAVARNAMQRGDYESALVAHRSKTARITRFAADGGY